MTRQLLVVLGVVAMIATIVGLDRLVFRDHFWARLLANVGIVMVCVAFYVNFGASP